jgi:hypothetical protein
MPTRKTAASPAIGGTSMWTKFSSTNELKAMATPTATGAANGKRRRANSGSTVARIANTSNHSGPCGPPWSFCRTVDSAIPRPTPTISTASNQ